MAPDRSLGDLPEQYQVLAQQSRAWAMAHLMFAEEENTVSGSSGCNRLKGSFDRDGAGFTFGPLATTKRACPPPAMELERRFHAALGSVTGYAIDGEVLTLEGPEGPVARFERYLE